MPKQRPAVCREARRKFGILTGFTIHRCERVFTRRTQSKSALSSPGAPPRPRPSARSAAQRSMSMDTQKLREAFNLFDRDGDGLISRAELDSVLKSVGANSTSEDEVPSMLATFLPACDSRQRGRAADEYRRVTAMFPPTPLRPRRCASSSVRASRASTRRGVEALTSTSSAR